MRTSVDGGVFFDSSAMVKCYVEEAGSAWVRNILRVAGRHGIAVARIPAVEVASAVVRHRPPLSYAEQTSALSLFKLDLASFFLILPVDRALVDRAIKLAGRHRLRAYDAIQLAAALRIRRRNARAAAPAPILFSADFALNAAAPAEGFAVDDPNLHP